MRRPAPTLALAAALVLASAPVRAADPAADAPAAAALPEQDKLERSIIMELDEMERRQKTSPLVVRDPALNAYVRGVLCRTIGPDKCGAIRLYLVRTPDFNASMAPNGMMQVWTGLLVRTANEAQLAAILGHEYAHYEQRHTLRLYREIKSKSAAAAWLAFTGVGLLASLGLASSLFSYSREMEREADQRGLASIAAAGYDSREAAQIWQQMRDEMDATAAARNLPSRKDKTGGMFASHPPTAERLTYLTQAAQATPGTAGAAGLAAYHAGLGDWWPTLIGDQLKRNDFGGADFLLNRLARDGWTAPLLLARGELYRRRAAPGDLDKAEGYFGEAIGGGSGLAELWRGRGLVRLKQGRGPEFRTDLEEYLRRAPAASDAAMIKSLLGETK